MRGKCGKMARHTYLRPKTKGKTMDNGTGPFVNYSDVLVANTECVLCAPKQSRKAFSFHFHTEQQTRTTLKRPETTKIAENITARGLLAYATLRFLNSGQLCRAQSPTRLCSKLGARVYSWNRRHVSGNSTRGNSRFM